MTSLYEQCVIEGNLAEVVFGDAVEGMAVKRSIEQAHTVEFTLVDPSDELLRMGTVMWQQRSNLALEGRRYVLVGWEKQSARHHLMTFEDWTAYKLRQFKRPKKAFRSKQDREAFARMLCREADVPFFAPEAGPPPPVFIPGVTSSGQQAGFDATLQVKIKGKLATPAQQEVLTTALDAALAAGAPERALIAVVMAITQESSANDKAQRRSHDGWQLGVLQQNPLYWLGGFDTALAVKEFLLGSARKSADPRKPTFNGQGFLAYYKGHLSEGTTAHGLAAQIERIQRSGLPAYYEQWYDEASRTVAAFNRTTPHRGLLGTDKHAWEKRKGESSWDCLLRLANEIAWRRFVVEETLWWTSDEWLFAGPARTVLREGEDAVTQVRWQMDAASKNDTATVEVTDAWGLQPGIKLALDGQAIANGGWLLAEWERDGLRPKGTLSLVRPGETIPEPVGSQTGTGFKTPKKGAIPPSFPQGGGGMKPWRAVGVRAYPLSIPGGNEGGVAAHGSRSGHGSKPGWESDNAVDINAPAGTPVFACEACTVLWVNLNHVSQHGGQIFGAQIGLGNSQRKWFYTHIRSIPSYVTEGALLRAGQQIGVVTEWDAGASKTHLHLGMTPDNPETYIHSFGPGAPF